MRDDSQKILELLTSADSANRKLGFQLAANLTQPYNSEVAYRLRQFPELCLQYKVEQVYFKTQKFYDLSRCSLTEIPCELFDYLLWEHLEFEENRIQEFPIELTQCQNLQILHFGDNKLTSIPPEIGQLQRLQELWLFNNELTTLPEEVASLQNLEELHLTGNPIPAEELFKIESWFSFDVVVY